MTRERPVRNAARRESVCQGKEDGMHALTTFALTLMLSAPPVSAPATERNKAVARQLFEEILGPNWRIDLVDKLHTPDFVAHGSTRDASLEEDRQAVLGWKSAAPDLTIRIERIVAEGDLVAVQWTGTGTNTGEGNGLPATGRRITARGMTIFRFRDGRIAEEWNTIDNLSVMRQLGLLPEAKANLAP
jgi:steroid delta-isomerase-like uncharacterized protein